MPVIVCPLELAHVDFAQGASTMIPVTLSAGAPYSLAIAVPTLGEFTTEQRDLFDALIELRKWLAVRNAVILVQGAARNVSPSGMQREMGGRMAYRFTLGKRADRSDVVDIFGPAVREDIATVEEQRANFERWVQSCK